MHFSSIYSARINGMERDAPKSSKLTGSRRFGESGEADVAHAARKARIAGRGLY